MNSDPNWPSSAAGEEYVPPHTRGPDGNLIRQAQSEAESEPLVVPLSMQAARRAFEQDMLTIEKLRAERDRLQAENCDLYDANPCLRSDVENLRGDVRILRDEIEVHKAAKDAMRGAIIGADSLCSFILHRNSGGLSTETKVELEDLVRRLRRITDPR